MRKSSESKSGFPNMETCRSVCPSDSEQNAPMTQVITVTSVAPRLRDMLNSSRKNAVHTSWSDMSEVRAASDRST